MRCGSRCACVFTGHRIAVVPYTYGRLGRWVAFLFFYGFGRTAGH